jgi:hypothetical protein
VLAFTPFPLWRRLKVLPQWQRVKPVMMAARVIGPACCLLLGISSSVGSVEGLMERILATSCVLWICVLAITLISVSRHARALAAAAPAR